MYMAFDMMYDIMYRRASIYSIKITITLRMYLCYLLSLYLLDLASKVNKYRL